MEPAFAPRKLDLLLHLVANLPHPVVLRGGERSGKTQLLRQFQSHAQSNWLTCYLQAGPNLTFDHVVEEALRLLRKPIEGYGNGYTEALEEQLSEMERQGRCLVLLLDSAGTLMPGLLESLVRYASLQPPLKLVCALTPEDYAAKTLTDPAAFKTAQVLPLAPGREGGASLTSTAASAQPMLHPAQARSAAWRKGWVFALSGLVVAGLLAVATVANRDWVAMMKDRLGTTAGTESAPVSAPAATLAPPAEVVAGKDQPAEPEPVAARIEPPAPVPAESAVVPVESGPPSAPAAPPAEGVGPALPTVAAGEATTAAAPAPDSALPVQPPPPPPAAAPVVVAGSEPAPGTPTVAPEAPATTAPLPIAPRLAAAPAAPLPKPTVPQGKPNTLAELRDAAWLLQQDPKGFTLQLITVSQPARLNGFVRGFPPSDQIAMYKTTRPAGDLYIVVYGIYPSFGAALAAAAELPSRQGRPVPRPLKAVQQEIHNTHARERAPESDKPNE